MDIKKRLNTLIQKDKQTNPKYLIDVIKSDFFYLISNYFEVAFDDININIDLENEKFNITIQAYGDRIKLIKTLPN